MFIETIKSIKRITFDRIINRNYITMVDNNQKKYLTITEYSYQPYDKVGKVETDNHKGTKFDKKV